METVTKKNISKYIRLSKLRIVELLLITTVPSMIVSIYGFPPLGLILFTLLGGTLLAVSAHVLNQIFEIETDRLMERTANRPLVTGEINKKSAYVYSISLGLGINTMHAISNVSIHTLWRDVLGGALISKGALCSFTRSGLSSSLHTDWCASADSSSEDSIADPIRMLPVVASALVFSKAKKEVETVTEALMRAVEEDGAPVYVLRVCQTMRVLSSIVHTARSGSLWECLVSRFCTPRGVKRSADN